MCSAVLELPSLLTTIISLTSVQTAGAHWRLADAVWNVQAVFGTKRFLPFFSSSFFAVLAIIVSIIVIYIKAIIIIIFIIVVIIAYDRL